MTITDRIQKSLAQKIISGALTPGQKLEEKALASQFGVSRTPIREAMRELSARGLVELVPRRGVVVATIGIDRLADMLTAECELEAMCAKLAARQMTALERGQLKEFHERARNLLESDDESDYLALNHSFHDLICRSVHNRTLYETVRDLRERLGPFRQSQAGRVGTRLARSFDEHTMIVDAILKSDAEGAYEAMRSHNARLSVGVIALLRGDAG
jgi:DNA-binding GntR family transcriptional regulator